MNAYCTAQGAASNSSDRVRIFAAHESLVIVLADGAGGTGHGAEAADAVVDEMSQLCASATPSERSVKQALEKLDTQLSRRGGQTTALIAIATPHIITGISVGDSEAWLCAGSEAERLTARQSRKPLLGSGATLSGFTRVVQRGATLLVASDGLFKYCQRDDAVHLATSDTGLSQIAASLIDAVRLPNGQLQDDVALALVRFD